MGRLTRQVLGTATGKIGNVIFRVRHKKSFIYAIPKKVNISQKEGAKKARNKFTPLSQFASFINSIPDLKYFWIKANIKASSSYHKISKLNYPLFSDTRPTIKNEIVPGLEGISGINPVTISVLDKSGVRIEASFGEKKFIRLEEEEYFNALAVICFYNPIKKWKKYFVFDKLAKDKIEIQTNEIFEVKLPFTKSTLNNYYSYRNSILYFTLITNDKNGQTLRFTQSHKCEFVHEFSKDEWKEIDNVRRRNLKGKIKEEITGYIKKMFSRGRKE